MALPTNIDTTFADSASDPSVQAHQQYHDTIHTYVNTSGASAPVTKTASYSLLAGDIGGTLLFSAATGVTLTIPTNAQAAFPLGAELRVIQYGAGQVTFNGGGSAGTVSVRSSVSSQRSTQDLTTCAVAMPATISTGDGLLVQLSIAADARTWTTPSGWVQVDAGQGPSAAGGYLFKYVNAPSSLAGTTQTFTVSGGSVPFAASAVAFANANTGDFIDGSAGTGTTITQTTPALTTVAAGCLEVGMIHSASGATVESAVTYTGSSLTSVTQINTSGGAANAKESIAIGVAGPVAAGTTIGGRASWSSTAGYGGARTVAVKPAATGGVTIRSAGGATKTAAQYADAVLTKIGTDEWLLTGYVV